MKLHAESHVDHVPAEVVAYVLAEFANEAAFFRRTIELPDHLPTIQNGLYGPLAGDGIIREDEVTHGVRPGRSYPSRLVDRPTRPTRTLTVIGGPYKGEPCVLYTVFGGPQTPREPNDPAISDEREMIASQSFWADHALAK